MIPLSVLDLTRVAPGGTGRQALHDTVRAAEAADALGYRRFWVAEHHVSPNCAGSSPAVLIAHIAASTRRIRVGSGGVMLTNYAPLVIAEQFAVLQALHGGRIDLGLGRASGGVSVDSALDVALRRSARAHASFPELVDELTGFLRRDWPADHPMRELELSPRVEAPDVYVLGTTENGARDAAERGLPFVLGYHLGRSKCRPAALTHYQETFTPGRHGGKPSTMASVNVLCAATDDEAVLRARTIAGDAVRERHARTSPDTPLPVVRVNHLVDKELEENHVVHGGPATVLAALEALAGTLGVDELMLNAWDAAGQERIRTLSLVAREARLVQDGSAALDREQNAEGSNGRSRHVVGASPR